MAGLFRASNLTRRLAAGGAAGFGARLGRAALSIAAAAVLARLLPPAAFGAYLLGQTLALFGSAIAVLGLENTLVREVAALMVRGRPRAARATLRRARGLVLLGAAGVALVLLAGEGALLRRPFGQPELGAMAGWIAAWVAFEAVSRAQVAALRGQHRLVAAAALDGFAQAAVFLAAVAWLAASGAADLQRVLAAGALSSGAGAAAGGGLLACSGDAAAPANGHADRGEGPSAGALWRRSWPLLGATVMGALIREGDLWMVGMVAAGEGAALYGSALKLTFLVALPLFVLNRTLSSTLAELHVRGRTPELEVLLRGTTTLVVAATGLVVLGLALFGRPLLALLFGEYYAAAAPILALLALGELVFAAAGPGGTMLMMAGHERLQLAISAASVACLVLGCLWAGERYGIPGVAAVSVSTRVLNSMATLVLVRRRVGVWSHAYLSPLRAREGLARMAGFARSYAS